jgi:hypothetical protein
MKRSCPARRCAVQRPFRTATASRLRVQHIAKAEREALEKASKGYNVVITGSTKGIGLALAREHLEQGVQPYGKVLSSAFLL